MIMCADHHCDINICGCDPDEQYKAAQERTSARARKVHIVKCVSPFFEEVRDERKPFEVRKHDRDYQTGDVIVLRHWEPGPWGYQRKNLSLIFRIGFLLRDYPAIRKGHCVFGLLVPNDDEMAAADDALAEASQ